MREKFYQQQQHQPEIMKHIYEDEKSLMDALKEVSERSELTPTVYSRKTAPGEMQYEAEEFEKRYGIEFNSLSYFSTMLMNKLHRSETGPDKIPDRVIVASRENTHIVDDIRILGEIVNDPVRRVDVESRKHYRDTLVDVYRNLPRDPAKGCADQKTLLVAVEREGRILAELLGWLPKEHSLIVEAKRVPYKSGLLIGLGVEHMSDHYESGVIIDGAIASGATVIAALHHLSAITKIQSWELYSVHGSCEGIRAIERFAESIGIDIRITVGHATSGLDQKYYAVDPADNTRTLVGDLGDMIAGLPE